ncbi:peptide deformylase [Streptomyces cuspidosporus]|uniref:Peptide deformylase n=1 Tax=Streptomyces cuspidosporus TaxID=66882 RepID=A0ABP5TLP4_9ACTN
MLSRPCREVTEFGTSELSALIDDMFLTMYVADGAEGCLSVPGATMAVPRPDRAVARGWDKDGNPLVIEGTGYFARCLQHEIDHLDGHLYLDRLSARDREDALRQMAARREDVFARREKKAAACGARSSAS